MQAETTLVSPQAIKDQVSSMMKTYINVMKNEDINVMKNFINYVDEKEEETKILNSTIKERDIKIKYMDTRESIALRVSHKQVIVEKVLHTKIDVIKELMINLYTTFNNFLDSYELENKEVLRRVLLDEQALIIFISTVLDSSHSSDKTNDIKSDVLKCIEALFNEKQHNFSNTLVKAYIENLINYYNKILDKIKDLGNEKLIQICQENKDCLTSLTDPSFIYHPFYMGGLLTSFQTLIDSKNIKVIKNRIDKLVINNQSVVEYNDVFDSRITKEELEPKVKESLNGLVAKVENNTFKLDELTPLDKYVINLFDSARTPVTFKNGLEDNKKAKLGTRANNHNTQDKGSSYTYISKPAINDRYVVSTKNKCVYYDKAKSPTFVYELTNKQVRELICNGNKLGLILLAFANTSFFDKIELGKHPIVEVQTTRPLKNGCIKYGSRKEKATMNTLNNDARYKENKLIIDAIVDRYLKVCNTKVKDTDKITTKRIKLSYMLLNNIGVIFNMNADIENNNFSFKIPVVNKQLNQITVKDTFYWYHIDNTKVYLPDTTTKTLDQVYNNFVSSNYKDIYLLIKLFNWQKLPFYATQDKKYEHQTLARYQQPAFLHQKILGYTCFRGNSFEAEKINFLGCAKILGSKYVNECKFKKEYSCAGSHHEQFTIMYDENIDFGGAIVNGVKELFNQTSNRYYIDKGNMYGISHIVMNNKDEKLGSLINKLYKQMHDTYGYILTTDIDDFSLLESKYVNELSIFDEIFNNCDDEFKNAIIESSGTKSNTSLKYLINDFYIKPESQPILNENKKFAVLTPLVVAGLRYVAVKFMHDRLTNVIKAIEN